MDRLVSEQTFHDVQAQQRSRTFDAHPGRLRFEDDAYLDHETWMRPALERLGEVRGLRVLDFGCGHGMAAVVLARRGARVTALDLSAGYLDEAYRRAAANGVAVALVQADGHRLPFAPVSFDRIWGNAVLHHFDLGQAAPELHRVLRPGGRAVFCEPWGGNALVHWARRRLPYPGKGRTPDEEPLSPAHIKILRQVFAAVEVRGYQLLGMVGRAFGRGRAVAGLDRCDAAILARMPRLQRFCRYVVIQLTA